ncbi:syntaxin-12-like isoform X2 [Amphiura filiformis]|uniref:syntaxin-12-like isoform X2 n=1 Tax=Amphiura filiformis TaxID=82378 RepID=UPI003B227C78
MSYGRGDFGGPGFNEGATYNSPGSVSGMPNARNTSDFNRLSSSVGSNVQKISQNVREIEKLVTRLETQEDTRVLRGKLDEVQHYTNQLAKDTNRMLKELNSIPLPSSQSDQRQQRMQKERLTNDFTTALNQFQRVQREAVTKERESVQRVRTHSGMSGGGVMNPFDNTGEALINIEGQNQSVDTAQVQMQEDDLQGLKERESQLKKLESDILDVNVIFKDLATMVHEQGDMIDSIEANVDSAEVHVTEANSQLVKARDYQKKSRKKCMILIICVIVLIGVLALILYLTLS